MTRDRLYLQHVAQSIHKIETYVSEGKEKFLGGGLVADAVIRHFEIIGEAVKRLSEDFRESNPAIRWKQIGGFRDVLIHQYFGVDLEQVWNAIVEELPKLKAVILEALENWQRSGPV